MEKLFEGQRVVVKVGSSSLTNGGIELNRNLIDSLVGQIAYIKNRGAQVAVVTSGAIASGRFTLGRSNGGEVQNQVLAAVGQRPLLNAWGEAFDQHNTHTGLFLFAEDDLDKPALPLRDALASNIVPIINANDTVSVDEIRQLAISADNDRLASFVARFLIDAQQLILLTESSGVLDSEQNIIRSIDTLKDLSRVGIFGRTEVGTGGMESKILEARRFVTRDGRTAYIAGAGIENVIARITRREAVGTRVTLPLQGYLAI